MWIFARQYRRKVQRDIAPDEIFLDSSNLPGHDRGRFEGRVERPVANRSVLGVAIFFLCILTAYSARAYVLQVHDGEQYAAISRENSLERSVIFATRGLIFDRTGKELAWNETATSSLSATSTGPGYPLRRYASMSGLAHVLGYVQYPKADASGVWWRETYAGLSGVELSFDTELGGRNGSRLIETDAHRKIERENIIVPPVAGTDLALSIDAAVQSKLYEVLSSHAERNRFQGGAAVIMDVRTGEILAITSFPEYDNEAFTDGQRAIIAVQSQDERTPLLDRAVSGLYTPGSIVKPVFAIAALNEKIISADKQIHSVGQLTLPNPYNPSNPSIFRDWTVHGWVDMRTAIAVSSDEYFYTIGGGFGGQPGLGVRRLDSYARLFGMGSTTGIRLENEKEGIIPTPEWKERVFGADDPWRIGNTYHTAIGQYGFQITPVQAVVFTAAIANGGTLLTPQLIASSTPHGISVGIPDEYIRVAREGMRMAVTSDRHDATVKALNMSGIEIAGKTGTAQLGSANQWMNSWSVGFWPASNPKYAYAVVLEKAPAGTMSGASPGLRPFFEWLIREHPEYVQ
ncbi:hypothetical protein FJY94_05075 [Candidatus Kaiserbacteria bacterium]|nr:hypothetical protein [Candidatus Kaiserbacteria bacterium]